MTSSIVSARVGKNSFVPLLTHKTFTARKKKVPCQLRNLHNQFTLAKMYLGFCIQTRALNHKLAFSPWKISQSRCAQQDGIWFYRCYPTFWVMSDASSIVSTPNRLANYFFFSLPIRLHAKTENKLPYWQQTFLSDGNNIEVDKGTRIRDRNTEYDHVFDPEKLHLISISLFFVL